MFKKILLTLLIITGLVFVYTALDIGQYMFSQEYASIAADQVNDNTDAYKALKTQGKGRIIFNYLYVISVIGSVIALFRIWVPRKRKR